MCFRARLSVHDGTTRCALHCWCLCRVPRSQQDQGLNLKWRRGVRPTHTRAALLAKQTQNWAEGVLVPWLAGNSCLSLSGLVQRVLDRDARAARGQSVQMRIAPCDSLALN